MLLNEVCFAINHSFQHLSTFILFSDQNGNDGHGETSTQCSVRYNHWKLTPPGI